MKRNFQPEDIRNLTFLSHPVLSSDSKKIAWIERKGNGETGLFPSSLCMTDSAGGQIYRTDDGFSYLQPCFLADGQHLLYLSDHSGEMQLYLKNLKCGVSCQLSTIRHGIIRYAVNEQETAIAFEAVLWDEEISAGLAFLEMNKEEKQAWQEELEYRPYEAADLTYKMDEWHGMRKGEYEHIGVLTVDLSRVKELLNAEHSNIHKVSELISQKLLLPDSSMESVRPSWSHDGSMIAFYGYPHNGARGRQAEIFICHADGTGLSQISENLFLYPDHAPVFAKDDRSVIGIGFPPYEDGSCIMLPYRIYIEETDQKKRSCLLPVGMNEDETEIRVCHGINPMMAGRTEMGEHGYYFRLSADGEWLYFLSAVHGKTGLFRCELTHPQNTEQVLLPNTTCDTDIQAFSLNDAGGIVWLGADATHPSELYYQGKQLTNVNEWLNECALGHTEEFWTKSRDGKADLQWFLVQPNRERKEIPAPAVLYIKGGPETMYAKTFWHEFQALSSAGFAVIYGNPRGSVGFGRAFNANGVCWCNEAMNDLLDIAEDAIARGFADRSRIGVTGGSYGGYMTNKLIGRCDVFSAAVTQRCLVNPVTSYGTGDMGFISSREIPKNFHMLDYLADRAKGNIISYIDQIKVPLLILHGMEDYRCGFEQAEQIFTAMKERHPDIPARLVAFPGENHNISRTGKLYHQILHLKELVDWFTKYLNRDGEKHE